MIHHLSWVVLVIAALLIWMGHRLRETLPGLANGLRQLGLSAELVTFFGLVSNHLPASTAWVPWLFWASTLLAQLVFLQIRVMHHDHYQEVTKAMLGDGIATTIVLVTLYYHSIPSAVTLVLMSISVGFAAIWVGLHTRETLPDFAIWLEQLGVDILLSTFFDLISKNLPQSVAWVPWLCCSLSLVASLWSQVLLQEW